MYGSNFWSRTRRPRCSRIMPIDAQVSPLPSELTTPPVTKMCLAIKLPAYRPVLAPAPTSEYNAPGKPEPTVWGRGTAADEGGGRFPGHGTDRAARPQPPPT